MGLCHSSYDKINSPTHAPQSPPPSKDDRQDCRRLELEGATRLVRADNARRRSPVADSDRKATQCWFEPRPAGLRAMRAEAVPFLLVRAMDGAETMPGEFVMIGDSAADVEAARSDGTKVIAFAHWPGKCQQFADLSPDGIVDRRTSPDGCLEPDDACPTWSDEE
ncbi:HAD hydrolase-like protein [Amycolatopsis sp. NPDC049253]|uniref:HAD family hydrolase n=1 Tax=Amycolatopsis sp. NPDC049253 TaxID=3155274 RepID=UPI00343BBC81